jgi:hypothetical protein
MVKVTVTMDQIKVQIAGVIENRRGLHAALASRLVDELQAHFIKKNAKPNKMAAKKTDFWKSIAQATQVLSVAETEAIVAVADARFRIHYYGGTIKPGPGKKALTIPLIPEARGLFARSYEAATGHDLFIIKGKSNLYEKTTNGIRAVYALKKSVFIPQDHDALPATADIEAALAEETADWIKRQINQPT